MHLSRIAFKALIGFVAQVVDYPDPAPASHMEPRVKGDFLNHQVPHSDLALVALSRSFHNLSFIHLAYQQLWEPVTWR